MARRNRRQSLTEVLGLSQPETPEETVARLERESQTLAMRLNSQGVDATKPAPKDSGLTKLLKTLGLPGAAVRSALGEATDDEYGFNASRAFSKERLWNNPVSGIQLLDQLGLAPKQTDSFGNKAARFGLGLGVDIVTDPISYLLGGITRPLQIGAPFASAGLKITEQGLAQPLLRGAQAGLRSTGELGAALGDAGVLAARKAATEAGTGALGSTPDAMRQAEEIIKTAAGQRAPRALTKTERIGLDLGTKLKENETARGIIGAFSKNAFADPAYVALRNKLARNKSDESREALDKLKKMLQSGKFTPEDAQLVADLAEDSGLRAKYAAPAFGEGPPSPLQHVTPLSYPAPKPTSAPLQQAAASELATQKAPTLLESLGLAEAPTFPSGRKPGGVKPPGAPLADVVTENNRRAAEVVEGLRNPNITPTHPRDVRRPDAEGTHKLLEDVPLQVLPDHVYQAFRFVTDTLKDYGDERLKRGLLSSILANYFPHKLLPEEGASIGLSGMTASQASAKTRTLRDTMANLADDPLAPKFERNFVRPFAKEVVESIRGIKTYDFFDDVVKQYGIKQDDMLARFGHQPGMNFTKPVGDYTLVDFGEMMNKGRQSEAYSKLGKVYLPNEIAQDLKQIHSAYDTDEGINTFLKMWDGASNVWKPLVTSLRPAFHVNNFIGNMWNSFLGGMTNPNRILDGIDIVLDRPHEWKVGATKVSTAEMKALGEKWGAFDASRFMDDLSTGNPLRLAQEGMPSTKENLAKTFFNKAVALGQRGGAFVEGMNRAALFTDQMLKRIATAGDNFTPDMLDTLARESADHVNKYLFDYAHGLTKFESSFVRRIAPFYSWTRFNLPLQVAEAVNQPGKFLLYGKVRDNLAQLNPSPDEIPPWMNEGLKVGTNKDGSPIIFNPRLPLQDISRLSPGASGRELTGMLNPLIKTPLELATNQNFYTGRPITKYEGETTPVFGGLMRVPTKLDFAATELGGAVGQTGKAIEGIRPDSSPADKLRTIRMVFPGLYSYDPRKERVNRAYEETRRLGDLIRKQQDETGKKVPTARQLGLAR